MEHATKDEDSIERGLECIIAGQTLVIPLEHVDQLIEYSRAPLPLAQPWVAGIGLYEDRLLVSLSLFGANGRGSTKAVLLRELGGSVAFALEVERTLAFVDVQRTPLSSQPEERWISGVISADGRRLRRIDIAQWVASIHSRI